VGAKACRCDIIEATSSHLVYDQKMTNHSRATNEAINSEAKYFENLRVMMLIVDSPALWRLPISHSVSFVAGVKTQELTKKQKPAGNKIKERCELSTGNQPIKRFSREPIRGLYGSFL